MSKLGPGLLRIITAVTILAGTIALALILIGIGMILFNATGTPQAIAFLIGGVLLMIPASAIGNALSQARNDKSPASRS